MKKNQKENQSVKKKVQFDDMEYAVADTVHVEELEYMLDEQLYERLKYIRKNIEDNRKNYNTKLWEIELCYVLREMQIREQRKESHKNYISKFSDDDLYSYNTYIWNKIEESKEFNLPVKELRCELGYIEKEQSSRSLEQNPPISSNLDS
jgi:hypothetical protein